MSFRCFTSNPALRLGSHALTRATHLQFRKPTSVLKKRKMSIKYYHSYPIHLHKSPSVLSLFLVLPEVRRNTNKSHNSNRHFEGLGAKHSFPDSFETENTGVQLFPDQCVGSQGSLAGLPHRAPTQSVFLIRGTVNSELKILQNRSKYHLSVKRTTIYRR